MSQTVAKAENDTPSTDYVGLLMSRNLRPLWIAVFGIIIAFAMRAEAFVSDVWEKEHYQYVLLVPVGAAFLLWQRKVDWSICKPGFWWISIPLLVLSALLCFDAFLMRTVTGWAAGLLLTVLALIYAIGGWGLFKQVWRPYLFFCLIGRPPAGLDQKLIERLQLTVSKYASITLDGVLGIPHILEGNIVRLQSQDLFVAEACSGINSLFATLAVLLFVVLLFRLPWLHAIVLLSMGLVAVLAINIFRVVTLSAINYASPAWGDFFNVGIPHTIFGLAVFVILLGMLLSCNHLIIVIARSIAGVLPLSAAERVRGFFLIDTEAALNLSPQTTTKESNDEKVTDSSTAEKPSVAKTADSEKHDPTAKPEWLLSLQRSSAFAMCWYVIAFFFWPVAMVEVASATTGFALREGHVEKFETGDPITGDIQQMMPQQIDQWQLIDYQANSRGSEFLEAAYSSSWIYRNGTQQMVIHVHRPYRHWHYLEVCYAGSGWEIRNKEEGSLPSTSDQIDQFNFLRFAIDKPDEGVQAIAYTMIDYSNCKMLTPMHLRASNSLRLRAKALKNLFGAPDAPEQNVGIVVMIQSNRSELSNDRANAVQYLQLATNRCFEYRKHNLAQQ